MIANTEGDDGWILLIVFRTVDNKVFHLIINISSFDLLYMVFSILFCVPRLVWDFFQAIWLLIKFLSSMYASTFPSIRPSLRPSVPF